jgi:glucan phosphoethanolaminetransferase (alkaline phosphatase superfamily)
MNEQISEPVKQQPGAAKLFSFRWVVEWGCLLSLVFLTGSTLNCLFQWFSYGKTWDLTSAIFSLVLAAIVYFTSFYQTIAFGALAAWAVFLPIIMKATGFNLA